MRGSARRRHFQGGFSALEPGDIVLPLDGSSGAAVLYDVVHASPLPLLGEGPGGVTVIWAVSTPSLPYTLDKNAATGALTSGQASSVVTPDAFLLAKNELVQARFKVRLIDTSAGSGAHVDMFDVLAYNPGSGQRAWGTNSVAAILNARQQVGDPADAVSLPLQDTNMGAPTSTLDVGGWLAADRTELFWMGQGGSTQQVPSFALRWNGAAATPAGIAVGLEVSGYRFVLKERAQDGDREVSLAGQTFYLPNNVSVDDIVGVPVAGMTASGR